MIAQTTTTEKRVLLRYDIERVDYYYKQLKPTVDIINERVIPMMQKMELEPTLEKIIYYLEDSDRMKADYIEAGEKEADVAHQNKMMQKVIHSYLTGQFEKFLQETSPWDDKRVRHPEWLVLTKNDDGNDIVQIDLDKIKESCCSFLDEADRPAWEKLNKIAQELNEFFKGRIENPLQRCFFVSADDRSTIQVSVGTPFRLLRDVYVQKTDQS